ncbi:inositol monophosphatase family protein [Candidatus Saccharibacteria bacterium]|nr:inositol monophosphatase family protein [Candidatus Saccharibacteria bacterium]
MDKEVVFFHKIAPEIIELVQNELANNKVIKQKGHSSNFATKIDVAVERLIVDNIKRNFPDDQILAEEEHGDGDIDEGRIWIIDPICGTGNLGRNIPNYCTNIALAIDGELVASMVVDYANRQYYWSVGEQKIWCNDAEYQLPAPVPSTLIEIDFGAIPSGTPDDRTRHLKGIVYLQEDTDYMLCSLNTSLSGLYAALHKIDGYYCARNHPWDIAASAFLMRQSGVILKDENGDDWTLKSRGYIAATSQEVFDVLMKAFAPNK